MSNEQAPTGDAAPYVTLFQKAHQKIVMLERLDEQFQQILTKRQELQDELREIQGQLNEQFDSRLKTMPDSSSSRPVLTITPEGKRGQSRFGSQAVEAAG